MAQTVLLPCPSSRACSPDPNQNGSPHGLPGRHGGPGGPGGSQVEEIALDGEAIAPCGAGTSHRSSRYRSTADSEES
jgi:hypothetical protein